MTEIWKYVNGYNNTYEISSYGRLRKGDLILKPQVLSNGYVYYNLWINGVRNIHLAHRLVGETFINKSNFKYMPDENVDEIDINTLEINHKDEDKLNNNVYNLEWCTHSYNLSYGSRNTKCRECNKDNSKSVCQYTLDGVYINTFNSIREAARYICGDRAFITRVCKGKQKTAYGYCWKFKNQPR